MPFVRRAVLVALSALVVLAAPTWSRAQCAGDCSSEIASVPKTIEKFVKARWKAVLKCGKKANPACPTACPLPDGSADPYLLSASCSALIACNLDALAESAYDTTWDDAQVCASAAATSCGNARATNAGKLVSTKLTRRRTNKMNLFAKDTAKCAAAISKVAGCDPTICDDAPDWIDGILPLAIAPNGHQALPFTVAMPGEGVATLTIQTVGTDWAVQDHESVVVGYDLDGTPLGQIVLYGGATSTNYRVLLGALTAGDHTIGLYSDKHVSPDPKAPVLVTAAADVESVQPGDPRYDYTRFAPILLGIDTDLNAQPPHPGNALSDTPLVEYASAYPGAGFTTYRYVMIWSNEDGGTGLFPDVLNAKWGRTTDIENIVEVDVDDTTHDLIEARYRPDESGSYATYTDPLRGGTHPVVRTSTANGLIAQGGESTLAFGLPPFGYNDAGLPRELGMDFDPTSYLIMAKEMVRESKIEPVGNPATDTLSDARNYVYIDYDINVSTTSDVLRGIAKVGGVTYYSDHHHNPVGLSPRISGGIGQTAVEVPPGTQIGDVQQFGISGVGTMSGTLNSLRAFTLDSSYVPTAPLTYTGPQTQSGTNPTWATP